VSEHRDLLLDSVQRMLAENCGPDVVAEAERDWPEALWALAERAGLPLAPVPLTAGGGGASVADTLAMARLAAAHAAPIPLGETGLLAGRLLAAAGLELPPGPLAAAWRGVSARSLPGRALILSGVAQRVPWGHRARRVAVLADGPDGPEACSVDPTACVIREGRNVAGEPRDDLVFDRVEVPAGRHGAVSGIDRSALEELAALLRAAQIAGALSRATSLTVAYAGQRRQFGRPIARFQAVGQQLAMLAAEDAAANAAVDLALSALDAGREASVEIAVAKVRAGQAAGAGSEIAHQIHGAIGFTREHPLHHFTRRLWAWREEHGNETVWGRALGERALAAGEAGLWALITGTTPVGGAHG
jgi:acyl-CoA dehydrogenase